MANPPSLPRYLEVLLLSFSLLRLGGGWAQPLPFESRCPLLLLPTLVLLDEGMVVAPLRPHHGAGQCPGRGVDLEDGLVPGAGA